MDQSHPLDRSRAESGGRRSGLLAGFLRMPGLEKLALLLAWVLLGLAALAIRLVAFKRLAPILGKPFDTGPFVPVLDARQTERAQIVKRAVRRAAQVAPLRADCLPQVLAGALLCRMFGVPTTAYLGVQLGSEPGFAAHAWLCAGAVPVTGGRSFEEYSVVLGFASSNAGEARRSTA